MYAGKKLRQLRLQLDKSQQDMASSLGLSQSYYAAIETGKRPISKKMVETISKTYQISEGYFDESDRNKNNSLLRGNGEGVGEGVVPETLKSNTQETRRFKPYFFYNQLTDKDLDFELSLEIEDYKQAFNDYKLLCETLHALNPPDFLLEKFPIPKDFNYYRQEAEEEFNEDHSHLKDERQRKILKIVDLYQANTEHERYSISSLIMYMHQYSGLIIARTVRETVKGENVIEKVQEVRKNKSDELNKIAGKLKS